MRKNEPLRIAVLFSRLSGYMSSCLRSLKDLHSARLLVIRVTPTDEAPFESRYFEWIDELYDRAELDAAQLKARLADFDPHGMYVSGWFDRVYLDEARQAKKRGALVVAGIDRQWQGTVRQQLGRLAAPWYLHSAFDILWAAGERQRQFAAKLGFSGDRCWSGVYACDWEQFASVYKAGESRQEKAFLFVGRYVAAKGITTLVDAYERYRKRVDRPWRLLCAGAGEQARILRGREGIEDVGFVQPDRLPQLMAEASTFVLPSRWEPWGVVVQEAAAAGLPLVCTDACGASVHLLQDRYNGYIIEQDNAAQLSQAMERISCLSEKERSEMSRRSHELSKQFTPQRWAATFAAGIEHQRRI